jgi:hypothetical protein
MTQFAPHRLSSVVITDKFDGRGPATSAHLRNWTAFVDRVQVGYFATMQDAIDACVEITR